MKKILTALLALMALVMALSLSACGGGSGDLTVEKGKLHMSMVTCIHRNKAPLKPRVVQES